MSNYNDRGYDPMAHVGVIPRTRARSENLVLLPSSVVPADLEDRSEPILQGLPQPPSDEMDVLRDVLKR